MLWYRQEDYHRLRTVLADGAQLPVEYDRWRISAEQVERTVRDAGVEVVRAVIEPRPFLDWCSEQGLQPDGAARTRFANEAALDPLTPG